MPRRTRFHSASPFEITIGFARGVRVGDRILISGTAPIDDEGRTLHGSAEEQATRCLELIGRAVVALGGQVKDVVRTRYYLTVREDWDQVARVHHSYFATVRPAATMVIVHGLLDPLWRVEVEAEAVLGCLDD